MQLDGSSSAGAIAIGVVGLIVIAVATFTWGRLGAPLRATFAVIGLACLGGAAYLTSIGQPTPAGADSKESDDSAMFVEAPEWRLMAHDSGDRVHLSSFKGKVVFLNLWATWCAPCLREMPTIESLATLFKDDPNVAVMLVNVDTEPLKASEFLRQRPVSAPVYFSTSLPPGPFRTSQIPATFIVDKQGRIRFNFIGEADWMNQQTVELIRELAAEPDPTPLAPTPKGPAQK